LSLTPGTRLGVYEIVASIGSGGMGQVFRARDTRLDRDVAIKILPEAFAHDADRLARFTREAKTLASLNHPNIAAIYGLEESAGVTALVMELVEGDDLSQRIARGAIPIDEALPIAKQIAEALEAAHEQGIIHRDLKPANIKVRPDGPVKVLDFGLAKAMEPAAGSSPSMSMSPTLTTPAMTQAGMILGTAAYMSPEQARGKIVDKRADVWAFGAVLFEMITGTRAFEGEDIADTLSNVMKVEPNWQKVSASTPPRVVQVMRACLQKHPKQRMDSAQGVRLALEGAFESAAAHAAATAAPPRRGRVWMVAAGASLLTALVVLAGTTFFRTDAPPLPTMRLEVTQPTTPNPVQFAVSPDGRYVVSVAGTDRGVALWLRALEGPERFVNDTEDGQDPFWSPDSRYIGFFANGKLKIVDITGGPARPITDVAGARGGSWSEDGTIVFSRSAGEPIYGIAATGGTPVAVTELDKTLEETGHAGPRFLPGGKQFVYLARSNNPEHHNVVYLGSLDSKARTKLTDSTGWPAFSPPGYLLFQRETTLMAQALTPGSSGLTGEPVVVMEGLTPGAQAWARPGFSVSRNGVLVTRMGGTNTNQLMWFPRSSTEPPTVAAPQVYRDPRLSPDGTRVAGEEGDAGGDLWLLDLARHTPTRFTFDERRERNAVWSPDGQRVAFGSERDGAPGLYVKQAGGATPEELLLKIDGGGAPTGWSADGRFIVYTQNSEKTKTDVMVLPLFGERKPIAVVQTPFTEWGGQLSPDGRWITYTSDESGTIEVYVQAFPTSGSKWKISNNGGFSSLWRRDGKELFYAGDRGAYIMSVTISAQRPGQLDIGIPQTAARARVFGQFDVTADGRRFLVNGRTADAAESSTLTVILNWTAALGAKK
jgi:Tol biopolymer transport system component